MEFDYKEYDYNTSRTHLALPEYGRNIQKMVDIIMSTEDRDERNRLAQALINVMGNLNPHLRDIHDFKHKLWDHLAIMSDFKLDIDYPYDVPVPETFQEKPKIVEYPQSPIRFKHYGKILQRMTDYACKLEEGDERKALVQVVANHMKKSFLTWNRDSVDDQVIFNDLQTLSKGGLSFDETYKLEDTREILNKGKKKKDKIMMPSPKKGRSF
jgi:hypothetical protein